uniref:Uncharacterized protein n=1 Tax=Aegilops tauschii subsp. strangulata TaxID=200361 RepID=A0A453SYM4_AEGTS
MYRSSSSNNNNNNPPHASVNRCQDQCIDGNNTRTINAPSNVVFRRGHHSMLPPCQISLYRPSIEEVFRSWEESRKRLPWNSTGMLITPEKVGVTTSESSISQVNLIVYLSDVLTSS